MEVKPTVTPNTPPVVAANDPNHPYMRDYWGKFRTRTYITITAAQCSITLITFSLLQVTGFVDLNILWFFGIVFLASAAQNIVTIWLTHILGEPFRDLVMAIVHVSGEPSTIKPPNPNYYDTSQDGFKEILQTVYEMSASRSAAPEETTESNVDDTILTGLNNTKTGIIIMDKNHDIIYHNKYAPVRKNTEDRDAIDLLFPEYETLSSWLSSEVRNKLKAEKTWIRVANKLPNEDGRRIFDVIVNYHKNSKAETVITTIDRTDEYKPEEDELDFISFAAHELRGPITVIRGYLDVLSDELAPVLQDDQTELMSRLVVTSNRLSSYVNNILSAARYDRRHLKLRLKEETLGHIYSTVADDMQLRARSQNRILAVEIPENLPTVAADTNAVGEVLSNLIDNAIKYSYEGGLVHVTAKIIPNFIEISISDHGVGMPANVVSNLFHKFYRSHRSRETVAGTGIGLYICRAIVSSHGGTIQAQSVENEGSTFTFTLPIYDSVAGKITSENAGNINLIEESGGWIKNHSKYLG